MSTTLSAARCSRSQSPITPTFPLSSNDLARWERFAHKGGIAHAVALVDYEAQSEQELMFLKGDEIIVLLELSEQNWLGFCEGVLGTFQADKVKMGKVKRALMTTRTSANLQQTSFATTSAQQSPISASTSQANFFTQTNLPASPESTPPNLSTTRPPSLKGKEKLMERIPLTKSDYVELDAPELDLTSANEARMRRRRTNVVDLTKTSMPQLGLGIMNKQEESLPSSPSLNSQPQRSSTSHAHEFSRSIENHQREFEIASSWAKDSSRFERFAFPSSAAPRFPASPSDFSLLTPSLTTSPSSEFDANSSLHSREGLSPPPPTWSASHPRIFSQSPSPTRRNISETPSPKSEDLTDKIAGTATMNQFPLPMPRFTNSVNPTQEDDDTFEIHQPNSKFSDTTNFNFPAQPSNRISGAPSFLSDFPSAAKTSFSSSNESAKPANSLPSTPGTEDQTLAFLYDLYDRTDSVIETDSNPISPVKFGAASNLRNQLQRDKVNGSNSQPQLSRVQNLTQHERFQSSDSLAGKIPRLSVLFPRSSTKDSLASIETSESSYSQHVIAPTRVQSPVQSRCPESAVDLKILAPQLDSNPTAVTKNDFVQEISRPQNSIWRAPASNSPVDSSAGGNDVFNSSPAPRSPAAETKPSSPPRLILQTEACSRSEEIAAPNLPRNFMPKLTMPTADGTEPEYSLKHSNVQSSPTLTRTTAAHFFASSPSRLKKKPSLKLNISPARAQFDPSQPSPRRKPSTGILSSFSRSTSNEKLNQLPARPLGISSKDFQEEFVRFEKAKIEFEIVKPLKNHAEQNSPAVAQQQIQSPLTISSASSFNSSAISIVAQPLPPTPSSEFSMEHHRQRELKWIKALQTYSPKEMRSNKKVQALVSFGVPPSVRGRVWQFLTESDQKKQENLFQSLCQQTVDPQLLQRIEFDVSSVWPNLIDSELIPVLKNFSIYRNGYFGYTTSISYLAGLLLTQLADGEATFWTLISLVENFGLEQFCGRSVKRQEMKQIELKAFEIVLEAHNSKLAKRLSDLEITVQDFYPKWISTFFMTVVPMTSVLRLVDTLLYNLAPCSPESPLGVPTAKFKIVLGLLDLANLTDLSAFPDRESVLHCLQGSSTAEGADVWKTGLVIPAVASVRLRDDRVKKALKKAEDFVKKGI